jgi:hypothetical protein
MGPLYLGNANYTNYAAVGTQTIGAAAPGTPGVLYGGIFVQNGTAYTATYYDLVVTGTTTASNQLTATTTAAGSGPTVLPGPGPLGVRFKGTLVLVTTGTAGSINTLWD